jgi:hypothetical protein
MFLKHHILSSLNKFGFLLIYPNSIPDFKSSHLFLLLEYFSVIFNSFHAWIVMNCPWALFRYHLLCLSSCGTNVQPCCSRGIFSTRAESSSGALATQPCETLQWKPSVRCEREQHSCTVCRVDSTAARVPRWLCQTSKLSPLQCSLRSVSGNRMSAACPEIARLQACWERTESIRLPEKTRCFVQILTFKSHPWLRTYHFQCDLTAVSCKRQ